MRLLVPSGAILLVTLFSVAWSSDVVHLQTDDFQDSVKSGLWLVEFYAPWCGHCKQLKPIYEKAATELKGKLNLAAVDAIQESSLRSEYGITGFPTIMLFKDGEFRESYEGARSLEGFKQYSEKTQSLGDKPASEVTRYTTDTFDDAVEKGITAVFFFAPWCGHCKRFKHVWEKVGDALRGQDVRVGTVDATKEEELRKQFQIASFPKILAFKDGRLRGEFFTTKQAASATDDVKVKEIVDWSHSFSGSPLKEFDGDLTGLEPNMVSYVLFPSADEGPLNMFTELAERHAMDDRVEFYVDTAEEHAVPKVVATCSNKTFDFEGAMESAPLEKFVKEHKKPWFSEIIPGVNFNEVMYDGDTLAAVVYVNASAHDSQEYLAMFKELAWEMTGKKFNFGSIDAVFFKKISEQVGIFSSNVPQLVVFNGNERVYYSNRKLARTKNAVKNFMEKAAFGDIAPKKPGTETEEKPGPPLPPKNKTLSDAVPSKLYGKYSSKMHSKTRTMEDRLTRTEEIMEQLLVQQKDINSAVIRLHEELFDLRTDLQILGDPANYKP